MHISLSRKVGKLVGVSLVALALALPDAGQQDRWSQLTARVVQLYEQGKYAEAVPMAEESLRLAETAFGPEHPKVATSLNNLALLFVAQEKFAEAERLYRRALSINEKTLGTNRTEVAANLNNLAELCQKQGRYTEAEQLLLRALAIREKAGPPDNPALATNLNNLAWLYDTQGKYAEAERLYRRALAIDEKALGAEAPGLAVDLNNLAVLYYRQGKYADAEPLYVKALSIHLKTLGKDHPAVATDLNNLGALYTDQGKYPIAESTYRRALEIDSKALGPDSAAVATDLNNLGGLYGKLGKYAEAEEVYRRALATQEKALGPEHPDVARLLNNLAALYDEQGKYGEAEPLYRRALAIRGKSLGPAHPLVGISLSNLARLYKNQGKYAEAEALYRRALAIDEKALGPEHPQVAGVMKNLAALYLARAQVAEADPLLHRALAIDEKALGVNHPEVAKDLSNLAELYSAEGKGSQAEPLLQRALSISEKALGPNSADVAIKLNNLGGIYREQGKYVEAEALLQRAIKIFENTLGPDHSSTGGALSSLAVTYYGAGQPALAGPLFDRSLANLARRFESSFVYMSEKERLGFLGSVSGLFPLYFSFAFASRERDPAFTARMYDVLLWEKGFIAASAAALRSRILAGGDPETLAILERLTAKKTQLAGEVSSPHDDGMQWRKNLQQLEVEANDLEKELVKRSAVRAEEKNLAHVTWRDVQRALKPSEAAVEIVRFQFHNGKSWTPMFYYVALVITSETAPAPKLIVLGEAQKLEAVPLAAYRANVGRTRGVVTADTTSAQGATGAGDTVSSTAYEAFWKPLEPALGAAKRVYVSTDGVLNQIPLGLLVDGGGKLMLEKYDLRLVNSTKDLLRAQHAAGLKTAVLVGNPKFDLSEAQQRAAIGNLDAGGQERPVPALAAHVVTPDFGARRSRDARGAPLDPLPSTQIEVDAVASLLRDAGWKVAPYTGERALEEALDRMRSPRVVHVATHGFFLTDQTVVAGRKALSSEPPSEIEDPMLRSGLYFAGANRAVTGAPPAPGVEDGVLTAYEATQLNLQGTELVVLSACETGLGEQKNGEGVFGLRRALQEAGAEAVMMSMWSVPDKETQELMTLFYKGWLGGLDKHEALRQAQFKERETVRQRYGRDLPFYWGAFVLVGR